MPKQQQLQPVVSGLESQAFLATGRARRWSGAAALLALPGLLVGCGGGSESEPAAAAPVPVLRAAVDACVDLEEDVEGESWFAQQGVETDSSLSLSDYYELADEDRTLIIETEGEDDIDGLLAYQCIVSELGTSTRVTSSIETTTGLMGRQSSQDGDLTYEYAYHPENGLYVMISEQQQ